MHIKKIISILLLPMFGILFLALFEFGIQIPCVFHKITGYYCPGCGMGRALHALFHMEIDKAFKFNTLGMILFPFLVFYLEYQMICWGFHKKDKVTKQIPKQILYGIIVITVLFGVMRNMSAFSWLAPI